MAHNESSHQDLYCLPVMILSKNLLTTMDMTKYKYRRVHFRNWWGGGCERVNLSSVHIVQLTHCTLRFFKIIGRTCGKICIYLLTVHFWKKRSLQDLFDDFYAIFFFYEFLYKSICCGNSFELHHQMGTHNIWLYKEVDKKYTGCYLKTMELLDCAFMCGN